MNAYHIWTSDQAANDTWLLFDRFDETPTSRVKPQYAHLYCTKCFKPHHEAAFEFGFEAGAKFRVRGHITTTLDGFFCVHDVVRSLIEKHNWTGLALKQVPGIPWHVTNVTHRVWANATRYEYSKQKCEVCGRHRSVGGIFHYQSDVAIPASPGTFFGPTFNRDGSMNGDRDVFITEDIFNCFKAERIKGAILAPLFNAEVEERNRRERESRKPAV